MNDPPPPIFFFGLFSLENVHVIYLDVEWIFDWVFILFLLQQGKKVFL